MLFAAITKRFKWQNLAAMLDDRNNNTKNYNSSQHGGDDVTCNRYVGGKKVSTMLIWSEEWIAMAFAFPLCSYPQRK